MPYPRLAASFALALLAAIPGRALLSGPPAAARGETEPPLRARVRIGDEVLEVDLGAEGRAADGRPVVVELLPLRTFARPGAFAFDYPRDWSWVGAAGAPHAVDGWWSLACDGALVHLRRHGGDPREIVDRYAEGLAALPQSASSPAEVTLQDRTLTGRAIEYDMGGIPGPVRRWRQEVYGWRQGEGIAWLLAIQWESRTARGASVGAPALWLEGTGPDLRIRIDDPVASTPSARLELEALLQSWRWQ